MPTLTQLPIPDHFQITKVGEVWRVPYQERASQAIAWAKQHHILPAAQDTHRVCLLLIDVQNTFCIPGFELFVGGRSGLGAVEDNQRICQFLYHNLGQITEIIATLDTHTASQIFHPIFWVDRDGAHPAPLTIISLEQVQAGVWQVNPAIANSLGIADLTALQAYALHYVTSLSQAGKFPLTIWPYHSMLGGIGHALVAAVEEACFFHTIARQHQTRFELKGRHPLTENYSILRPEVMDSPGGAAIAEKNLALIHHLLEFDAIYMAGQAKSHCVAWSIDDLLTEIDRIDPRLAKKVYLLEDCTSPVVVPGIVDFTDQANAAFQRFAAAGVKIVRSTDPLAVSPFRS
ncbi:MAG: isochorismatase [Leptolyngbyaceae cyanobacterium]